MPTVLRRVAALAATAVLLFPALALPGESASDLAASARTECDKGQEASERADRKQHFERGEGLATQAIALDDGSAPAHFALVCNLGELLRLDGEKLTSLFLLRRLLSEVNRTLELDP